MKRSDLIFAAFFALIFTLCIPSLTVAQRVRTNPEQAEKLRALYPKQDFVLLRSESHFTFEVQTARQRKKATVYQTGLTSKEEHENELIALKQEEFADAVFSDSESKVERVYLLPRKPLDTKTEKYKSQDFFHHDIFYTVFSLGELKENQYMGYRYIKTYNDAKYMSSVYFTQGHPVLERKLVFVIPDWLDIELKEMNFEGVSILREEKVDAAHKTRQITYLMKDVPAYKRERRAPHNAHSLPHILILYKSYTHQGERHTIFETTQDLYNWYKMLVDEVENDPSRLQEMVTKLTEGKTDDFSRIESIFYWVQENIRYIAFEQGIMGYKPEEAHTVFANRYGDCKGMANLLKEMLILAGYDARLTWIGTSDLPYDYSTPSLAVDNHMICTVILNGQHYYLDGTEEYIAINDYAYRIQGRPVLIEDGENYLLDKVPSFGKERNLVTEKISLTLNQDVMKGRYTSAYNGEYKTELQRFYASTRTERREETIRRFLSYNDRNLFVSNIRTSDFADRKAPLKMGFDFDLRNQVTQTGKEVYVNIDMQRRYAASIIDEERVNDYEFRSKLLFETVTDFELPSGYSLDYLPDAYRYESPEFSFDLSYTHEGNKIIYRSVIAIDEPILRKQDFPRWNECIKKLNKFYNDQIVLVKE